MARRLILIAHGETQAMRAARFPDGEPLTPRGRAATARLQGQVPRVDRAWSSPAAAARETAALLAPQATIAAELDDLDCGAWRGRALEDILADDPAGAAAWRDTPAYAGHGGLSIVALLARTSAWMDARTADSGVGLGLTHAAVLRCAVLAVTGAPASGFWRIDVPPLTRAAFSSDGRRWTLRHFGA